MTLIRKINPKYFFWFSLILSLTLRVKYEINFPQLDSDYATETEAAKNFIEGHGFTTSSANPANLNEISFSPLTFWPVGYAMALVPLYYITGNFIDAAVLLQCISTIILIFGFIKIFNVLQVSKITISLFLLFYAFTPTPFSYLGTTDMLTGAIFLWAIAYSIELFNIGATNWKRIILISSLLIISCIFRFASIPNIVILPLFLGLMALYQKKYKLLVPAIIISLISLAGTFIFFSQFKIDNTRTGFLQNLIHFNLYFKHMLWFDSFPIKALFFPRPLEYRLPHDLMLIRIARIVIHLASLLFGGYIMYYFYKKIKNSNAADIETKEKTLPFLAIFICSTVVISSFISMQSLTTPPEGNSFGPSWMPKMWTFVYATRYFVIPILLFQVLFFMLLNDNIEHKLTKINRLIASGLYVCALIASLLQWSYTTKQYHFGNGAASFWHNGKSEIETFNILNQSSKKYPGILTVYSCFNRAPNDGGSLALYSKGYVCRDYKALLDNGFKHSKPMMLYVLMPNSNLNNKEAIFISSFNAQVVEKFDRGTLYKAILK